VGPLWLKKNERLKSLELCDPDGLGCLDHFAKKSAPGPAKSFEPTGNKILELFRPVKIVYIKEGGTVKRFLPERYLKLSRALRIVGFEMEIFTKPRSP